MSKNQLKKMAKKEKWEQKKFEKRRKEKEKYKKTKSSYAHLNRFSGLTKDDVNGEPKVENGGEEVKKDENEKPKLSKKEKQALFRKLCDQGPKYIIDCEFEDMMIDKEIKSMAQQLAYTHSMNKKLK